VKTLLCVEDDKTLLKNNSDFFIKSGYNVLAAENLSVAREQLAAVMPDAILLDIMLPDGSGLDLLSELRESGNKVPVIMLTAWGEPQDVSRGYRLGATAYLSKPFDYDAVLAAIEGIFGHKEEVPETVRKGALLLDVPASEAFVNGEDLLLTPKQFSLLLHFAAREGQVMTAEYLYRKIWGQTLNSDTSALRNAVYQLRKKLTGSGYTVTDGRGDGYCFKRE
jgi:DNA-binding response OmpR family regulator